MKVSEMPDPFKATRENSGVATIDDQNDPVTMVMGLKDVRKCAHNWKAFQSGGDEVGRIVVPSEVAIRDTRQIPFEVDPPKHGAYRAVIEPWFKRPLDPNYQAQLKAIIDDVIDEALSANQTEVVEEFALKLQSRALTVLLNTYYQESETWINWGTHVFRSDDTALDGAKASLLYDYIEKQIEKAARSPCGDLYSVLLNTEVESKTLTKEEVKGVMILTFPGGRDTVINAITNTIAYIADNPDVLSTLSKTPEITSKAVEELIRYFSPLTHMGRVVTEDTHVCEHAAKANSRISLCWASANRDERVFENPDEIVLDRKLNPHVGFGFGTHNCLGATHARQILAILLSALVEKVDSIDVKNCEENIEDWDKFQRKIGFHALNVKFNKK